MAAFSLDRDLGCSSADARSAGELQYDVGGARTVRARCGRTTTSISRTRCARRRPVWAAAPGARATSNGSPARWCRSASPAYYNLAPTDIRSAWGAPPNVDVDGNGRIDSVAIWQGGVELRARWRGGALQAEWFGRDRGLRRRPGLAGILGRLRPGELLHPPSDRLQVAARLARSDLPLYGAPPTSARGVGRRVDEQTAGDQRLYSRASDEASGRLQPPGGRRCASAPDEHRVRAAVQLGF